MQIPEQTPPLSDVQIHAAAAINILQVPCTSEETPVQVTESPICSTPTQLQVAKPRLQIMDNFVSKESVTRAEIKWSLHNTFHRTSLRCGSDAGELFEDMFPDSDIAKKFSMHKDKLGYVITHGLGLFFQSELTDFIRSLDFVTVSFDESFNPIFHQSRMGFLFVTGSHQMVSWNFVEPGFRARNR
ncbi:hypothetical protein QAD02_015246 [Eretmocerus hayati]|uniref:Uncharacterized protein n=1 Tax=Eretmocerus hayati TaxID=131215 RepID=A0ACC2PA63_9HYME|nr:hypothetical protein QAD02_015246 [Eretmocerus hayati]